MGWYLQLKMSEIDRLESTQEDERGAETDDGAGDDPEAFVVTDSAEETPVDSPAVSATVVAARRRRRP
ncbi:hypothetical protein BJF89_04465 [Corynebacterium sp. CNJ-954]|nr:hypothetical protein BJF89_04465 [Corynebacterium sp. CNJ-954]